MLLMLLLMLPGACRFNDLAFRQDDRLTFVSPSERAKVALPVTVDWEIDDFDLAGSGEQARATERSGYFAVFVDRPPQPPGEPLDWFARDDEQCQRNPACPHDGYFEDRGIYTTQETEFTIEALARSRDDKRREMHEVTVVLMDADSRRIGESAWRIKFEIDRGEGG